MLQATNQAWNLALRSPKGRQNWLKNRDRFCPVISSSNPAESCFFLFFITIKSSKKNGVVLQLFPFPPSAAPGLLRVAPAPAPPSFHFEAPAPEAERILGRCPFIIWRFPTWSTSRITILIHVANCYLLGGSA